MAASRIQRAPMRSRRVHLRDFDRNVQELPFADRLTNGLRTIFDLLATLAGLILSASALDFEIELIS